jgi:hypothetical protein
LKVLDQRVLALYRQVHQESEELHFLLYGETRYASMNRVQEQQEAQRQARERNDREYSQIESTLLGATRAQQAQWARQEARQAEIARLAQDMAHHGTHLGPRENRVVETTTRLNQLRGEEWRESTRREIALLVPVVGSLIGISEAISDGQPGAAIFHMARLGLEVAPFIRGAWMVGRGGAAMGAGGAPLTSGPRYVVNSGLPPALPAYNAVGNSGRTTGLLIFQENGQTFYVRLTSGVNNATEAGLAGARNLPGATTANWHHVEFQALEIMRQRGIANGSLLHNYPSGLPCGACMPGGNLTRLESSLANGGQLDIFGLVLSPQGGTRSPWIVSPAGSVRVTGTR